MEIEKMLKVREKLTVEQKKIFDESINTVGETFKQTFTSAIVGKVRGEKKEVNLKGAKEALNTISKLAKEVGIDFPEFKTDKETRVYVLEYGKEIVNLKGDKH